MRWYASRTITCLRRSNYQPDARALCEDLADEEWHVDWCRALFVPLPKKRDLQCCENHRTISLICHASKIMLKILLNRMTQKLVMEIDAAQAGFMKHRGTRDHIFILQLLIQKCYEMNRDLYICFVDYSKAFDNARYKQMWTSMLKMGFPPHVIKLIKSLYSDQQ